MTSLAETDLDRQLADLEAAVGRLVRAAFGQASPRAGFADELRTSLAAPGTLRRDGSTWVLRYLPRRPVWAALAAGLVGLVIFLPLAQKLTPEVDARALVNDMQNAVELVPAGQVRHLVTTYTTSPALQGSTTHRLEQWFATVDGRPVSRQTGLLGETTVLDASGTGWQAFARSSQVVKLPNASASNFPALNPNRMTLDAIGAGGARPRVLGRTTVDGRPATRLELLSELPHELGTSLAPAAGVRAQPPGADGDIIFVSSSAGLVAMPPGGGSLTSELVVDDRTHEIVQGHVVSKDTAGRVFGTTDWRVTTDELLPAASVASDLFTFVPPAGTTVTELQPGEPFQIQIE
jgi:hypothetical protein